MATLEFLKTQLAATKTELVEATAHVHRCDGAIQVLEHLIKDAEDEVKVVPNPKED